MTTAKEPRKRLERKCECGAPKWKHSAGVGVCIEPRCACGVFRPAPKPRKRRETPEQKARRVGKGLGFYLEKKGPDWFIVYEAKGTTGTRFVMNDKPAMVALWRALARARGVRLG